MIKETKALETALAREAVRAFEALGYRLDAESASAEALAADEELLTVADEARDRARETPWRGPGPIRRASPAAASRSATRASRSPR